MNAQQQLQLRDIACALMPLVNSQNYQTEPNKPQGIKYTTWKKLLVEKYPHTGNGHGSKRALIEYNAGEVAAGRTKVCLTEGMEQKWKRIGIVPLWAYRYLQGINTLPPRPPKTFWTEAEVRYLADLITKHSSETYDQLAVRCSRRFGRSVSVGAIKGTTDRCGIGKLAIAA
jgi:hypothetical protein